MSLQPPCSECGFRPYRAKNCRKHYPACSRSYANGRPVRSLEDRFLGLIEKRSNGCWEWQGASSNGGYGNFKANGKTVSAYKWAYEHFVGTVPDGLQLDHLCRNRSCCNPDHLEPVTPWENYNRAKRDVCKAGHPFDDTNTTLVRIPRGRGVARECKACRREISKRYRARKKAAAA